MCRAHPLGLGHFLIPGPCGPHARSGVPLVPPSPIFEQLNKCKRPVSISHKGLKGLIYYLKLRFLGLRSAWEDQWAAGLVGHLRVTLMFCNFVSGSQLLPKTYRRDHRKRNFRQITFGVKCEIHPNVWGECEILLLTKGNGGAGS